MLKTFRRSLSRGQKSEVRVRAPNRTMRVLKKLPGMVTLILVLLPARFGTGAPSFNGSREFLPIQRDHSRKLFQNPHVRLGARTLTSDF